MIPTAFMTVKAKLGLASRAEERELQARRAADAAIAAARQASADWQALQGQAREFGARRDALRAEARELAGLAVLGEVPRNARRERELLEEADRLDGAAAILSRRALELYNRHLHADARASKALADLVIARGLREAVRAEIDGDAVLGNAAGNVLPGR